MAVTNGLALPIPELTDTADGPDGFSDLANAVEDYVLDRILPAGVTRYPPHHWGSGTSLPTATMGAKTGDLYLHTGLVCTMRCITPGNTTGTNIWRQAEIAIVASLTARDAIGTNYSALLYEGFEVQVQTVAGPPVVPGQKNRWTGIAWGSTGEQNPPGSTTEITYAAGFATYVDVTAQWNGLRYWKRGDLVTVSGAFTVTPNPQAIRAVVGLLPVGFRPPYQVQDNNSVLLISTDGNIRLAAARAAGYVDSSTITYGVA